MGTGDRLTGIKKIAILRANALGDYVFSLPALESLRACYPQAEITLLGRPWHETFLAGRPSPIDRVFPVPFSEGIHDPPPGFPADQLERGRRLFFERMRAERFDLAIQIHGGGRYSNPFLLELGAATTAGLRTPDAAALDRNLPYHYFQREVLRYLETVALVGARPLHLEPRISVTPEDVVASQTLWRYRAPFIVLHPGAGDPRRRWPSRCFAAVGDALSQRGFDILVNGRGPEESLAREVVQSMKQKAHALTGRWSLGCFLGLLRRAALIISNDSGPLHLARAAGTPTIGLYWCGNLLNAGPMTCARHRFEVSWRLACPVCGIDCVRGQCNHRDSFVTDISLGSVTRSAEELLHYLGHGSTLAIWQV